MSPHTTYLALSEAEYILCRQSGEETARQKLDSLIQSRIIEVVEDSFLLHDAARVKCGRAIALADCYTIALAQKLRGTALFARPEEDLERESRRRPFPVPVAFLQSGCESPETTYAEGVKPGKPVNIKMRKTKKSAFGAARGIGPFTSDDEMKDHD